MAANILLIILFISAIVISILVLLQNKGGDMGSAFGGGSNTLFGARGSADFLTRATSITAIIFFLSALSLAYIYSKTGQQNQQSVIQSATDDSVIDGQAEVPQSEDGAEDTATQDTQISQPKPAEPDVPEVPE